MIGGLASSCRYDRPLAASRATLSLLFQSNQNPDFPAQDTEDDHQKQKQKKSYYDWDGKIQQKLPETESLSVPLEIYS